MRHDGGQPVERWFQPDYWRSLIPECTISDGPCTRCERRTGAGSGLPARGPLLLSKPLIEELRQRMNCDGYFELSTDVLETADAAYNDYVTVIHRLEIGVRALVAAGWPASFIVLFDEAWHMVQLLGEVMRTTTGGNECMMDLVAWHIDPSSEEAGFTPHRDRQLGLQELNTDQVAAGFRHPDGSSPRDCTCWIALSEASCDNGCLYVVPRSADPAYAVGDCTAAANAVRSSSGTFKLQANELGEPVYAPTTDSAWQQVRALPCTAGSAVFFSHRLIHWGSKGRAGSRHGPRISISFAASDHNFKVAEPYFDPSNLPLPPFCLRTALAAAQMLCYAGNGRFALERIAIKEYKTAFKRERKRFKKRYRSTVKQATRAALALCHQQTLDAADVAGVNRRGTTDGKHDSTHRKRKRGSEWPQGDR